MRREAGPASQAAGLATGRGAPGGGPGPVAGRARLTSRAAALAVVICAVVLSLAYPVREYIAQRRQIDQLQAQQQSAQAQLKRLSQEQQRLNDPAYIEQLAMDRLHLCMPGSTCYEVIGVRPGSAGHARPAVTTPWYERLWASVQQANRGSAR